MSKFELICSFKFICEDCLQSRRKTGVYNVTIGDLEPVQVTVLKPAEFVLSNLTVDPLNGTAPLEITEGKITLNFFIYKNKNEILQMSRDMGFVYLLLAVLEPNMMPSALLIFIPYSFPQCASGLTPPQQCFHALLKVIIQLKRFTGFM